jgi:hypothetical protein
MALQALHRHLMVGNPKVSVLRRLFWAALARPSDGHESTRAVTIHQVVVSQGFGFRQAISVVDDLGFIVAETVGLLDDLEHPAYSLGGGCKSGAAFWKDAPSAHLVHEGKSFIADCLVVGGRRFLLRLE